MKIVLCSDGDWLLSEEAYLLYASCMYQPKHEDFKNEMESLLSDYSVRVYGMRGSRQENRHNGSEILKFYCWNHRNCYVRKTPPSRNGKAPDPICNDILNGISEIRTSCGFREKVIQVANRLCDVVALEWPICWVLGSFIQELMESEHLERINAQTDDESVEFYRKCGFTEERIIADYPDGSVVRYNCILSK